MPAVPPPAPKGNKYAQGHSHGRPRTTSFSPEEMVKLGEQMVEFVSDPKNKVLHLSEWYTVEMFFTYNEWKQFINKPEFYPYYEKALKIIGKKYIDKTSNVRDGISHRWQRVYFKDLKEEEDSTSVFLSELQKAQAQEGTEEQKNALKTVLDWVANQQKKT